MALRGGLKLKESEIELMIGHLLRTTKACFWKQNVRGFFKDGKFRKDRNPYAKTGLPDYVELYRGFHCGYEVKATNGKQTENQKEFEAYVKTYGGAHYYVVKSVDDVRRCQAAFRSHVDRLYAKSEGLA